MARASWVRRLRAAPYGARVCGTFVPAFVQERDFGGDSRMRSRGQSCELEGTPAGWPARAEESGHGAPAPTRGESGPVRGSQRGCRSAAWGDRSGTILVSADEARRRGAMALDVVGPRRSRCHGGPAERRLVGRAGATRQRVTCFELVLTDATLGEWTAAVPGPSMAPGVGGWRRRACRV